VLEERKEPNKGMGERNQAKKGEEKKEPKLKQNKYVVLGPPILL